MDQPNAESIGISEHAAAAQIESLLEPRQSRRETEGQDTTALPPNDDDQLDDLGETEGAQLDEEGEQGDEQPEAGEDIRTLDDLALAMGKEKADVLAGMVASVKIDGQEQEVPLGELINGYQRQADYTRKTQEHADAVRAWEGECSQWVEQRQAELLQTGHILNLVKSTLVGDPNSPEFQQLRQTNPAEWAAQLQEMQRREAQFGQLMTQLAQQHERNTGETSARQKAEFEQMIARESEAVRQAIPDWSEQKYTAIAQYAIDHGGFSPEEVAQTVDHRVFKLLNRLVELEAKVGKVDLAAKKVKNLPKLQPLGQRKPVDTSKAREQAQRMRQVRKTGSVRDAAAALEQFIQ